MSDIDPLKYPVAEQYKGMKIEKETPTSVIDIDSNVIILYFEGGKEKWYLATIEGNKIKDYLLIGERQTIETESLIHDEYIDFFIDVDFNVKLEYSSGLNFNERKMQKTENYSINNEMKIIQTNGQ